MIDGGPDALLVQKPAAVALCRELGLGDRLVSTLLPRTAYVLRDGRLHPLVEGSFLGFPIGFGCPWPLVALHVGRQAADGLRGLRPAAAMTTTSRSRRSCGGDSASEAVDYLAEPLLAGIHAGDVERLSMRALFPRLLDAERQTGSVLRSLRALRVAPSPRGAFVSLPGGIGELVDAVSNALHAGTVVTGARVTEVRRAAHYTVRIRRGDS